MLIAIWLTFASSLQFLLASVVTTVGFCSWKRLRWYFLDWLRCVSGGLWDFRLISQFLQKVSLIHKGVNHVVVHISRSKRYRNEHTQNYLLVVWSKGVSISKVGRWVTIYAQQSFSVVRENNSLYKGIRRAQHYWARCPLTFG